MPLITTLALTTLPDVKALLLIPDPVTTYDALLEKLINSVSAEVSAYCDRAFGRTEYVETLAPTEAQKLMVKQYPIRSVVAVRSQGSELQAGIDYQVFEQFSTIGEIYREQGWSGTALVRGLTGDAMAFVLDLEIDYIAGFWLPNDVSDDPDAPHYVPGDPESLPLDLSSVVEQMVCDRYYESVRENVGGDIAAMTQGKLSYTFAGKKSGAAEGDTFGVDARMPPQFARLLAPYRRWSLA